MCSYGFTLFCDFTIKTLMIFTWRIMRLLRFLRSFRSCERRLKITHFLSLSFVFFVEKCPFSWLTCFYNCKLVNDEFVTIKISHCAGSIGSLMKSEVDWIAWAALVSSHCVTLALRQRAIVTRTGRDLPIELVADGRDGGKKNCANLLGWTVRLSFPRT